MNEVVAKINTLLGTDCHLSFVSKPILMALSVVMPMLREVPEMLYQFDDDYVMSSAKFMTTFADFRVTSYDEGLAAMVKSFQETK